MRSVAVVIVALWTAGAAGAATVRLPSPTQPLGEQPPLRSFAPATPVRLPRPPLGTSSQTVLVDVTESGVVTAVRVRQRLTLEGLGDFFFQIPAPVRDVRALPQSQGEPGLRRGAILWQGFSRGRRVLAAELDLVPAAAAEVLPLRIERRRGGIALLNTTAVDAPGFLGPVQRSSALTALRHAADRPADATTVEVAGPTRARRIRVDAPLRVSGSFVRAGRTARRFRLVLGGPAAAEASLRVPAGAQVRLTAEPVPLLSDLTDAPRNATGRELLLRAERVLLRLARVNQYRTFLASPTIGRAEAVYRVRTVTPPAPASTRGRDGGGTEALLVVALVAGGVLALGGAVVAWAHL